MGNGTQMLEETLEAKVQGAECAQLGELAARVDTVRVSPGLLDPPHQPPVAAGGMQHPPRRLGRDGDSRIHPPRLGSVLPVELDDLCRRTRWASTWRWSSPRRSSTMCSARLTAATDWLIWCVTHPTYQSIMDRMPFFTNEPAARSDSTGTTGSMKVAASTMRNVWARSPPRPATGEWAKKSSSSSRSSLAGMSPAARRSRTSSAISSMTCAT